MKRPCLCTPFAMKSAAADDADTLDGKDSTEFAESNHDHAFSEMESENYSIHTSVLSGGGAPVSSTNYKTNSTLGQSSPLMNTDNPPNSDSYDSYPGFWYTAEASLISYICFWDLDERPDGDVDGIDLAEFIAGSFNENDLEEFAAEFGRIDCQE